MDKSSFMPHHRPPVPSDSIPTDNPPSEEENTVFSHDQEDEDLLNSVTEVANAMLIGQRSVDSVFGSILGYDEVLGQGLGFGIGGQERSRGQVLRGHDMEWRSIM